MDQDKIGKLIAKLRKEKGLTQRELGDKVGVGFKAVSKWERGITCPDISIINELSKILGITADELLAGKLNNKTHKIISKKINKKILLFILLSLIIISIFFLIYNNHKNKMYVYNMYSPNTEYYVEGKIIFKGKNISLYLNKLKFIDKEFNKTIIKNYEYEMLSGHDRVLSYGYIANNQLLLSEVNIIEFTRNFRIDYDLSISADKTTIIKNELVLKILFLDNKNNLIEKNVEILLKRSFT